METLMKLPDLVEMNGELNIGPVGSERVLKNGTKIRCIGLDNDEVIRSNSSSIEKGELVDLKQNWEKDRWRFYFVKYHPDKPPVKITGNDATALYGDFDGESPGEYTIYMKWAYVPPTPLNIVCYDPNGMNEIYGNTFVGITTYEKNRHGEYGDSGEWGTSIMFVMMNKGPAEPGKYSASIHDNQFFSNDLFINSYTDVNMDVKVEKILLTC
jgi:hypothetical protein